MKCRNCNQEIVFVRSTAPRADAWSPATISAHHAGVNLHDADLFGAGATIVEPSSSYAYKLRLKLEEHCRLDVYPSIPQYTRKERTMNDNTGPINDALTKLNAAQRWSVSCPQGPEDFDELMRAIADGEHDLHLLDFAQRIEQRFAIPVNDFDWDQVSLLIERDRLTADEVDRMIHAGLR